jgi:hypothetical protein
MMEEDKDGNWSGEDEVLTARGDTIFKISNPPASEWKCYMYGSKPNGMGMVYTPTEDKVPNFFVRWMMKVCLGCTWEKDDDK